MTTIIARRGLPRGFSLVEVSVASGLMAFLAVLLSQTWTALGRPLAETAARARLAQEADLALAALSRDLGGSLSNSAGRIGAKSAWAYVGRLQPGGNQLWLCFDGGSPPNGIPDWAAPDAVISYEVDGDALVRVDHLAGTSFVVARHVASLAVSSSGNECQITLTFVWRTHSQTYSLIAIDP